MSASYRNFDEFLFMANIGGREPYLPVKVTWNLSWITRMWKILLWHVRSTMYQVRSTKYQVRNTIDSLDTWYYFSISNAERWFLNVEVGIRIGIGITLLMNFEKKYEFLLCTWYLVHCTSLLQNFNPKRIHTSYLILDTIFQYRTPNADFWTSK